MNSNVNVDKNTHTPDIYVNTDNSSLTSSFTRSASSGAIQPVRTRFAPNRANQLLSLQNATDKIASFTFCFLLRKEMRYKQIKSYVTMK